MSLFFALKVSDMVLLALSPLGTLSSDGYFTFYCLEIFCFKTGLIYCDGSNFFSTFSFFFFCPSGSKLSLASV